jgi:YD repeat-containing protein
MRIGFAAIIPLLASLALPAVSHAWPADSLVLASIATRGSVGDTLHVQKFTYSQDNQGFWYETDSYYRHDSVVTMERKTYNAARNDVFDTLWVLQPKGNTSRISTRSEYDGAGRPVRAVLGYNDSLIVIYGYEYTASGKLSKWTLAADSSDPTKYSDSSEFDYAYDAEGHLLTETRTVNGVLKGIVHYGYDANGRIGTRVSLEANGDTSYAKTFAYDGEGRMIREITDYGKDTLSFLYSDIRTEYDAQGQVKKVSTYGKSGSLQETEEYAYQTVHVPVPIVAYRLRKGDPSGSFSYASGRDALGRAIVPMGWDGILLSREGTGGRVERSRRMR